MTHYRGVEHHRQRFRARIKRAGKLIHLGSFATADEAHAAYCSAAAVITLSPHQSKALSFIARYIELTDRAPSQDQIAMHLGTKSRNSVDRTLKGLERKGMIKREMYKVRGIQVIKQELRA